MRRSQRHRAKLPGVEVAVSLGVVGLAAQRSERSAPADARGSICPSLSIFTTISAPRRWASA